MTLFLLARRSGFALLPVLLGLVALPALAWLPAPAAVRAADSKAGADAVRTVRDVPYVAGPDRAADRHQMDLFLPRNQKDFPVLVLVHGGAWMYGDKGFFGHGTELGEFFAGRGIGVVVPGYRLAPAVKYADQMQDLARAIAWVYAHIADYGGDPDRIILCGHSAGGHLVSLLATDPSYLKAAGLEPSVVKGVVSVSGVYRVPEISLTLKLPAVLEKGITLPGGIHLGGGKDPEPECPKPEDKPASENKVSFGFGLFDSVFGDDPKVRRQASPLTHVRPGLPPFLVVYAEHDFPLLPGMAREFVAALKEAHDVVRSVEIADRDHETVMFRASQPDDPVGRAICNFVAQYSRPCGKSAEKP